ncbi:MAG: phenylalanine--tRNA ligase subunit beta [Gammaproteobacteria bacterium]|nr:MAG: phenylalanine--tRNA ligase subunit beta [Gammaproteobacteria bacterium]
MKVSIDWLREWLDLPADPEEVAERLTSLGLEVDSIERLGEGLEHIVVGEVREVSRHPDADRLSLCRVDVGGAELLNIVCGAANLRAGGRYPVALPGAVLPGGLKIERSKIRGETSDGMLCSAFELQLAETADGIMELPPDLPLGEPIARALRLDDAVLDIDLTPNRADCFCVAGIARDLAAGLRSDLRLPRVVPVLPVSEVCVELRLDDPAACPRFAGRVITELNPAAETPEWMQSRLLRAGVRPIHPVVDVTNYVMLEFGQPMHAYDLDRLTGGLSARRARDGERCELLDGREVELDESLLIIADEAGPVGLAGIMGGARTAVQDSSRNIFLEAAFFSPAVIAGRARRLGLHTDAATRFERGVDPEHQLRAIERATALLQEITGGRPGPATEVVVAEQLPQRRPVRLRRERLARLLGTAVPDDAVADIFERLDMQVASDADGWRVTPPPARFDIEREEDLVEEVARIHGYDRIPETPGEMPALLGAASEHAVPLARARLTLVERGYHEAVTWSFTDPDLDARFSGGGPGLPLANPISGALSVMRQSLWPGLALAVQHNVKRQQERVRLFETGLRFQRRGDEAEEIPVIAGIVFGSRWPEQWALPDEPVDFFDIKGDVLALTALSGASEQFACEAAEHPALRPGRAARLCREGEPIGWLGELHPELVARLELPSAPLLFEIETAPLLASAVPAFRSLSRFPAVRRDLSPVVAETVPAGELLAAVRHAAGPLLRELRLFDIYRGDKVETGSKSVSLGLILQDTSRTLTDADVDEVMQAVAEQLRRDFNATIRE